MADVVAPLRHLKTYPTDGPVSGSDMADHQIAAGTVPEGYALRARNSATRKALWTNDAGADINNPLRAVLAGDSAEISNSTSAVIFNKELSYIAGSANIVGAVMRITAHGKYSSKTVAPGTLSMILGAGAAGAWCGVVALPAGIVNGGWSAALDMTVRTTGAAATVSIGANYFAVSAGGGALGSVMSTGWDVGTVTVDLTTTQGVHGIPVFSLADTANKITLQNLTFRIELPGVVVT